MSAASPAESFDYVIVGAGAAGCVLADRLTASGEHRVLVLEAGGKDDKLWIRVPAGFMRTMFDPDITWGYDNLPSPATNNRVIPCPRGKVLGGSSSINGHAYVRGQALDYEDWVALGAPGWGWQDVLPYFKRAETRAGGNPAVRGTDGPLHVQDPRIVHPLTEAYFQAMEAVGQKRNPDYNSGDQEGCGYYQQMMKRGRRWSAADAYLRPAMARPNLLVRLHAHATKIVLDGRRAVGIEYRFGAELRVARAEREVILSGGAINTPQLMQLSGIGDPKLLQHHGIAVHHALPEVGENMADHFSVRVANRVKDMWTLNERAHPPRIAIEAIKYFVARRGLLSSAPSNAMGFVRVLPGATRPDTQIFFTPASSEVGKVVGQAWLEREPGMTCGTYQTRPFSRGYVRIASPDPLIAPDIQPHFLAHERDQANTVGALKFLRKLFAAPSLARYIVGEIWPGPEVRSDDELLDFARRTGTTVYHPVGSCRMGNDERAPVDPQLRVKGIDALRVIDASVMPQIVSGNTYAATITIAERGADLVLGSSRVTA
jgi:choline dehydrogenase